MEPFSTLILAGFLVAAGVGAYAASGKWTARKARRKRKKLERQAKWQPRKDKAKGWALMIGSFLGLGVVAYVVMAGQSGEAETSSPNPPQPVPPSSAPQVPGQTPTAAPTQALPQNHGGVRSPEGEAVIRSEVPELQDAKSITVFLDSDTNETWLPQSQTGQFWSVKATCQVGATIIVDANGDEERRIVVNSKLYENRFGMGSNAINSVSGSVNGSPAGDPYKDSYSKYNKWKVSAAISASGTLTGTADCGVADYLSDNPAAVPLSKANMRSSFAIGD